MGFMYCLNGCTSTSTKVSMHSFPTKYDELCRLWLKRINNGSLPNDILKLKSYRICTLHFRSICKRNSKTHPLIWNSIPVLNLPDFNELPTEENCFLQYNQRQIQHEIRNKGQEELTLNTNNIIKDQNVIIEANQSLSTVNLSTPYMDLPYLRSNTKTEWCV